MRHKDLAFSFKLDDMDGYLRAVLSGEACLSDLVSVMDAMTTSNRFRNPRRLWDLRNCQLDVSSAELRSIAAIGKSRDTSIGKGALLVGQDLTYGLSRIHQVFRESDDHSVHVFRSEDEAIAWLAEDSDNNP